MLLIRANDLILVFIVVLGSAGDTVVPDVLDRLPLRLLHWSLPHLKHGDDVSSNLAARSPSSSTIWVQPHRFDTLTLQEDQLSFSWHTKTLRPPSSPTSRNYRSTGV
jgi:hypothetical protein